MVHHASHRRLIAVPPSGSDAAPGAAWNCISANSRSTRSPGNCAAARTRSTSRPRRSPSSSSSSNAGPNALTKAALQESLWPDTFVVEANLSNLVAEIRAALEDDVRHPRFIRTVHGFGYAFCGTVSGDPAAEAPRVAARPASSSAADGCIRWQKGRTCWAARATRRRGSIRPASRGVTPGSSSRTARPCSRISRARTERFSATCA